MKLSKIAGICKKSKSIVLFDKEGEDSRYIRQYIGDGGAMYPIDGLPYIDVKLLIRKHTT